MPDHQVACQPSFVAPNMSVMLVSWDRTGLPLVTVPDLGVEMQLLPFTKLQAKLWLTASDTSDHAWYEAALALNPSIAHQDCTTDDRERLFFTGLLPSEVLALARWMGDGFEVPTVALWHTGIATRETSRRSRSPYPPHAPRRRQAAGQLRRSSSGRSWPYAPATWRTTGRWYASSALPSR